MSVLPILLLLLCFSLATANLNSNAYPPSQDSAPYTHNLRRQLQLAPLQGTFYITSVNSNLCLDVIGASTNAGTNVEQWYCNQQANQQWTIQSLSFGVYSITSVNSNLCLDVTGQSTNAGTNVEQWYCNGQTNQQWILVQLIPSQLQLQGTFYITSVNSNLCLDVIGDSTNAGTNVQQWYCDQQANQQWTIQSVTFGVYSITSVNSGLCLDVTGQSTNAGTNVEQWNCNGQTNQQWTITPTSNNAYIIVSVNSGICLDVTGQSTIAGTIVEQWYCNGLTNQQWTLQPV